MANEADHISIHIPKYENELIHFDIPQNGNSQKIIDIQNYVAQKAEQTLERCKSFEVSLPPSITGIANESNRIEFKSLFQTPTLNELEILSENPDGSPVKLNQTQLRSVENLGEFEVDSIHFPGQRHRWKLSKLLQSGTSSANQTFYKELSRALFVLIIFARDRFWSNFFSFKTSLRALRQGFASLIDAFIGLPAVYYDGVDVEVENERLKFLVTELLPHPSQKSMHEEFCAQIPVLLDILVEHERYGRYKNKVRPPKMLPYPHHFVTPNSIDIDLRLHNQDLQEKLKYIVSFLLEKSIPKNWFQTTKRRLINQYKHEQTELGLSKQEIAQRVQIQLYSEYAEQLFDSIERSVELEQLSPGLGRLLVSQARATLAMQSVVKKLTDNVGEHLKMTREKLTREHPIKSKIQRWIDDKIFDEKLNYIHEHEWDAHQLSIEQCKRLGNQQAAYFIQRDLTFRKDHESILRLNLKTPAKPSRTISCNRLIWFPRNWIIERTYPLPAERIPTQFAKHRSSSNESDRRAKLIDSDPRPSYAVRRKVTYSTTTRYPFWRWKLFLLRTYCWLSNTIFMLCLVIPFASPVSFRALLSTKPFQPDYELNEKDLLLYEATGRKTQTFVSRLVALWNHVRYSRRKFEEAPDRGFLGKNVQRMFNRIWNYAMKGAIGTLGICLVYPIACSVIPTFSLILGVLSPIWLPIVTLIFHILQILFYDANSAGEYGRKLFCVINIILTDVFLCGLIQPVAVLFALLASPIASLLCVIYAILHRCTRGMYDKIMYHLVVKRFARIPAHNSFLARRVAGPGLAAEYFYQVSSPEVLAALESLIEQNELKLYRAYVEKILRKPIDDYRQFFDSAFEPFSMAVQITNKESVFGRMNDIFNEHAEQLRKTIEKRNELLKIDRSSKHDRIRLTENDLTAVLIEGTQLVEKWYPKRILPYMNDDETTHFWNGYDIEPNDWFGLTSKLLQELFCHDFLTPLEQTDVFYSLSVDHLSVSKYVHMINSANLHDDLDVVTSVYLPETSYRISPPTFDERIFDPHERILDISTNYSGKRRIKSHGRIYRYFNRTANYLKHATNASRFVDYTSITCHFSIPIRLPNVPYINIIIFNRDNNNSINATTIKNISPSRIFELIDYNKEFYKDPILPIHLSNEQSSTPMNNLIDDGVTSDNNEEHQNENESNHNIVVLDESLL